LSKKNICLSCGRKIDRDKHYCPEGCKPKYKKISISIPSPSRKISYLKKKIDKDFSKRFK